MILEAVVALIGGIVLYIAQDNIAERRRQKVKLETLEAEQSGKINDLLKSVEILGLNKIDERETRIIVKEIIEPFVEGQKRIQDKMDLIVESLHEISLQLAKSGYDRRHEGG